LCPWNYPNTTGFDNLLIDIFRYVKEFRFFIEEDRKTIQKLNDILDCHYKKENANDFFSEEYQIKSELNNSLLISTYGKYESAFNTLCLVVKRSLSINLTCDDLRGTGFKRVIVYLEKLNLLDSKKIKAYDKIDSWRIIRNSIAHNHSVPEEKDEKHVLKTEVFWSGDTNAIHITKDTCLQLIEDIEYLFQEIVDEIENL
jgi:hypothetical protein